MPRGYVIYSPFHYRTANGVPFTPLAAVSIKWHLYAYIGVGFSVARFDR